MNTVVDTTRFRQDEERSYSRKTKKHTMEMQDEDTFVGGSNGIKTTKEH